MKADVHAAGSSLCSGETSSNLDNARVRLTVHVNVNVNVYVNVRYKLNVC